MTNQGTKRKGSAFGKQLRSPYSDPPQVTDTPTVCAQEQAMPWTRISGGSTPTDLKPLRVLWPCAVPVPSPLTAMVFPPPPCSLRRHLPSSGPPSRAALLLLRVSGKKSGQEQLRRRRRETPLVRCGLHSRESGKRVSQRQQRPSQSGLEKLRTERSSSRGS